jgi:MFS family permease
MHVPWFRRAGARRSAFSVFLAASASAYAADGIRAVALPLLAVALTRDPALVAGLGVAQSLPFLVVALPAGLAADRVDRRRLLVVINSVEAGLFGLVVAAVLLNAVSVPLLYVLAFCLGSTETVRDTATTTAVPALVAPHELERANGRLVTAGFLANQLAAPVLGAALFVLAAGSPFLLSAGLAAVAAVLVVGLPALNRTPSPRVGDSRIVGKAGMHVAGLYGEVVSGIRFLARHRILRTIALLAVVLAFTDAAWFAVLILLLTDELGLPDWGYGVILAVAAIGGAAGGWLAGRIITRVGAAMVLRGGLAVIGGAQVTIGLTHSVLVATAALTVGNVGFAVWLAAAASQRQRLTPDRLLGRVTAAWRTAALGAIPLGALAGGLVAQALGLRAPFLVGAPLVFAAALLARPLTARALAGQRTTAGVESPPDEQ